MRLFALACLVAAACGGSQPPAAAPAEAAPTSPASGRSTPIPADAPDEAPVASSSGAASATTLPTTCADPKGSVCTPPGAFIDRLCAKPHSDTVLALFAPSTPFTRAYLKGRLDELLADEETIVLRFHAPSKGGMVVGSGLGTYDLLRWDGTCSTGIEAEAVTRTKPARPRTAHLQWHRIGSQTQDALIAASEPIKRAHARRGKECKGAMTGDVSAACQKADEALGAAVVDYVRSGAALPPPDDAP